MDNTKEYLINTIKKWVKLDNEIKALKKEVSSRQTEKKGVSETLITLMKNNEIDCFDIKDGQICYNKKNIKKPITKKNLLDTLSKYFENDPLQATELNEFIQTNREEVVKEVLTIKTKKD
jgi:hypothetical protein